MPGLTGAHLGHHTLIRPGHPPPSRSDLVTPPPPWSDMVTTPPPPPPPPVRPGHTHPGSRQQGNTVNVRAERILLECILVLIIYLCCQLFYRKTQVEFSDLIAKVKIY